MVDALKQIWRVLKRGGNLIDMRPRAANLPLDVLFQDEVISAGWVDDSRDLVDDVQADEAIAMVVGQGYYIFEKKTTFPFQMYWDTLAELRAYAAERWKSVQLDETTLNAAGRLLEAYGPAAKLRTHRELWMARYRKRSTT